MPFSVGDPVRTRLMNPDGHTRLPVYLRGRRGRIQAVCGAFPFSDARARGVKDARQTIYSVLFRASDVWGADAPRDETIVADLFESYLEADR